MNKEVQSIIKQFETVNTGQPWFGRAVFEILDEVDISKAYIRPAETGHSLAELLYHMITWAEFTLKRLEGDREHDLAVSEKLDWREIDQKVHTWDKGMKEFKEVHSKIIAILKTKDDEWLKEIVDYRKYNFRFLLNGLIQHNIYHLGQIAYINKLPL